MKNKILNISSFLLKVSFWVIILLLGGYLAMVIHWHFSPETYSNLIVTEGFQAGFGGIKLRYCSECNPTGSDLFFKELGSGMVYWSLIRLVLFSVPVLMIIKRFQKILQSLQARDTFYADSIQLFRTIASLGFVLTLLSSFNFLTLNGNTEFFFTVPFGPLLFSFGCLVLSEVFREGSGLVEDKKSIV